MIVLDTHAVLWWVNGDPQLSPNALAAIEQEMRRDSGVILISAITAWEIALLLEKGRITLSMGIDDWLDTLEEIEGVRIVPVDKATLVESTRLPGDFHKDPADRMIVALARHFNATLITADEKINDYRHVKTLW
ncbi:MAG: type II toxin-antitoxin system VapC family toxin [Gammaproteobacteria bacterium]|nr:type II toxin-antitoxin system VapC family toxin [Gammaproteobacteria bacterium]